MGYPGDTSLSREIQLRILSTFKQTLRQADRGQWDEAHFGCDFMLRLDPAFEPARALKRRMADDNTVVELDDLLEISAHAGVQPLDSGEDDEAALELIADDASDPDWALDPELLSLDLTPDEDSSEIEGAAAPAADGDEGFELELDQALSDLEVEGGGLLLEESEGGTSATKRRAGPNPEAEQRVVELLAEGQSAFDRKDYQQAIDAWSRIFLIDIDHVEASRLIDEARLLKAESERELDEILHEGISHLEIGQDAMARDAFNRVLALQPNHLVAKEYLAELDTEPLGLDTKTARESVVVPPLPRPSTPPEEVPGARPAQPEPGDEAQDLADIPLEDSPDIPPAAAKRPPRKSFLYIGTAVLLLAAAAGWYLLSHWDQIFPNSTQESSLAAAGRTDPIERARKLHESGKTSIAISQLERLAPEDPKYPEAQALIASLQAPEAEEAGSPDTEAIETAALLASLESQMYEAYDERRYLKSSLILDRIAEVQPLSEELREIRAELDTRLAPIQPQIDLIQQGEWEYALPQLWRLLDEKPDDRDVLKLLVDGYFNLGVRDLQRGHPTEAAEKFREALSLSPDDSEIQRLDAFAQAYRARSQDLRYRIFIKYVPFR